MKIIIQYVFIGIVLVTSFFVAYYTLSKIKPFTLNNQLISPIAASISAAPTQITAEEKPSSNLKSIIESHLVGLKGEYSIFIKNLKTGENYTHNDRKVFEAGSLYKLWIMATVFQEIKREKIDENESLTRDVTFLNEKFNIASDEAELTEGTVSMTVKNAMFQMITISHNYAALLLSEKVRLATVRNLLKKYELNDSIIGEPPTTTAYDTGLFFEKIYNGEIIDKPYSQKMIDLLKQQTRDDKLPKYLPLSIEIANKTGEIDYYSHDGGIIFGEKSDYIIVVLSKSNNPQGANEQIAQISKSVYNYFEK